MSKLKSIVACTCMFVFMFACTLNVSAKDMTIANPEVEKVFSVADGITLPESTFSFDVVKNTPDGPDIHIQDITFERGTANNDQNQVVGYGSVLNSNNQILSAVDFPHAGVYEYIITEHNNGDYTPDITNDTITYDTRSYKFSINVVNSGDNSLTIRSMVIKDQSQPGEDKATSITFNNKYEKTSSLTISKTAVGDYADRTKDFDFTITITAPSTSSATSFTGYIGDEQVNLTSGQQGTFKLHHGESLVFEGLPTGSTWVVAEVGAEDGYMAKATVVENGGVPIVITADSDEDGVASSETTNLLGENTNSVAFENTLSDNPATGIFVDNAPYIIIAGILILGVGVYFVLKKKLGK